MVEPPPRDPPESADDETVIVPPDRSAEETVISDGWGPESDVFVADGSATVVEETETETVPPRRPLIWPWLLALLVAVLAGIGAYLYFAQQDESTVPAVTGMRQEPAEAAVRDAGLEPESTRQQSSKPEGIVLGQSPDAGASVDEGSTVRLVVSTGPPAETVPDVVGETQSQAVAALTAAGFESDVTEAFSDKKAGIVVSQEPKAGEQLDEGGTVALTVSKGGKPVIVPDVVGTTSAAATAKLEAVGLKANPVAVPSEQPEGQVVAQSPAPGKDATTGDTVRLNVARPAQTTTTRPAATTPPPATTTAPGTTTAPPEPATVPDAVGTELADAATAFAEAGLKVGVKYVPSDEAQGEVIAQAKPAGSEAKRGDTVQVNVSIGAEPAAAASVPNVAGRRLDEARQALDQAGFETLALDLSGDELTNSSAIGSQTPAGGASIPGGSLVILYARG
jgi:eukaryotic-like serine/threonine-protein kinase